MRYSQFLSDSGQQRGSTAVLPSSNLEPQWQWQNKPNKPLKYKSSCRCRRDWKKLEQWWAQGAGDQVQGAREQVHGAISQTPSSARSSTCGAILPAVQPVSLRFWSTQGQQYFIFSLTPSSNSEPQQQWQSNKPQKPLKYKSPCCRDWKRLEQQWVQGAGEQVQGIGDQVKWAGHQVQGAGRQAQWVRQKAQCARQLS